MEPKQNSGGRELDKTSTPAAYISRPICFQTARALDQTDPGGLAELKEGHRQGQRAKWFDQVHTF